MGFFENVWSGLTAPFTQGAQAATVDVVALVLWVVVCVAVAFMGFMLLVAHPLGAASYPLGLVLIVAGFVLAFWKLGVV